MRISKVILVLVHALVLCCTLVNGASIDTHEADRVPQTAVFNLLDPVNEKRVAEEAPQHEVDYDDEDEDEEYYYDEDEDDYEVSGDNMPRVAFSSNPSDPSKVLAEERLKEEGRRRRGKGRRKGKGKGHKRNPCLKKYKDFCIHGTCQYLANIRRPSCICHEGYSGERCHDLIWVLSSSKTDKGYNRTTALAVVAVVLSSLCLIIIGLLLALRFHKRGAYDVENEEKVKLGAAPHH